MNLSVRRPLGRLSIGLLLSILLVLAGAVPAAAEIACANGWTGPNDGCKYAKAKVETACIDNCNRVDIRAVKWRGGTASGSCDPSNDVTQWRLEWVKIVRASDGAVRWSFGPGAWHYNCNVDATTYSRDPGLTIASDHLVKYKWQHVTQCCGPFFPRVDIYVATR